MSQFARAAVLTGPRRIEMERVEIPAAQADDGVLEIEACGVCGSDVPAFTGDISEVRAGAPLQLPLILGHEIVGRIADIGPLAAARWGVSAGDRIVVERWLPCGHCELCLTGDYRLCVPMQNGAPLFYGGTSLDVMPGLFGGYAEALYLHPNSVVYKVPEDISAHHVPLFTPLGNAISWLQRRGGVGVGSHVAIIGPGQEGLCAIIAAVAAGAQSITVLGLAQDRKRLDLALKLGATATVVLGEDDPVDVVRGATSGAMAEVILDVTSAPDHSPIELAVEIAGKGARIVMASAHPNRAMTMRSDLVMSKLLTLIGVMGRDRDSLRAALALLASGRSNIDALPSQVYALDQAQTALEDLEHSRNDGHAVVAPGHPKNEL